MDQSLALQSNQVVSQKNYNEIEQQLQELILYLQKNFNSRTNRDQMRLVPFIQSEFPFFQKLKEQKQEKTNISLLKGAQHLKVPKGQCVFYKNDDPKAFYIVLKGQLGILKSKPKKFIQAEQIEFEQQAKKVHKYIQYLTRIQQKQIEEVEEIIQQEIEEELYQNEIKKFKEQIIIVEKLKNQIQNNNNQESLQNLISNNQINDEIQINSNTSRYQNNEDQLNNSFLMRRKHKQNYDLDYGQQQDLYFKMKGKKNQLLQELTLKYQQEQQKYYEQIKQQKEQEEQQKLEQQLQNNENTQNSQIQEILQKSLETQLQFLKQKVEIYQKPIKCHEIDTQHIYPSKKIQIENLSPIKKSPIYKNNPYQKFERQSQKIFDENQNFQNKITQKKQKKNPHKHSIQEKIQKFEDKERKLLQQQRNFSKKQSKIIQKDPKFNQQQDLILQVQAQLKNEELEQQYKNNQESIFSLPSNPDTNSDTDQQPPENLHKKSQNFKQDDEQLQYLKQHQNPFQNQNLQNLNNEFKSQQILDELNTPTFNKIIRKSKVQNKMKTMLVQNKDLNLFNDQNTLTEQHKSSKTSFFLSPNQSINISKFQSPRNQNNSQNQSSFQKNSISLENLNSPIQIQQEQQNQQEQQQNLNKQQENENQQKQQSNLLRRRNMVYNNNQNIKISNIIKSNSDSDSDQKSISNLSNNDEDTEQILKQNYYQLDEKYQKVKELPDMQISQLNKPDLLFHKGIFKYQISDLITAKDQFGEKGLVLGKQRKNTVLALEDTELLLINRCDFDLFMRKNEIDQIKQKVRLFLGLLDKHLSFESLAQFAFSFAKKEYKYGSKLFIENQKIEQIYFIKQGDIEIQKNIHNIQQKDLNTNQKEDKNKLKQLEDFKIKYDKFQQMRVGIFQKDHFIMNDIVLNKKQFSYSAQVVSDHAEVYILELEDFIDTMSEYPQLRYFFTNKCKEHQKLLDTRITKLVYAHQVLQPSQFLATNIEELYVKQNPNNIRCNQNELCRMADILQSQQIPQLIQKQKKEINNEKQQNQEKQDIKPNQKLQQSYSIKKKQKKNRQKFHVNSKLNNNFIKSPTVSHMEVVEQNKIIHKKQIEKNGIEAYTYLNVQDIVDHQNAQKKFILAEAMKKNKSAKKDKKIYENIHTQKAKDLVNMKQNKELDFKIKKKQIKLILKQTAQKNQDLISKNLEKQINNNQSQIYSQNQEISQQNQPKNKNQDITTAQTFLKKFKNINLFLNQKQNANNTEQKNQITKDISQNQNNQTSCQNQNFKQKNIEIDIDKSEQMFGSSQSTRIEGSPLLHSSLTKSQYKFDFLDNQDQIDEKNSQNISFDQGQDLVLSKQIQNQKKQQQQQQQNILKDMISPQNFINLHNTTNQVLKRPNSAITYQYQQNHNIQLHNKKQQQAVFKSNIKAQKKAFDLYLDTQINNFKQNNTLTSRKNIIKSCKSEQNSYQNQFSKQNTQNQIIEKSHSQSIQLQEKISENNNLKNEKFEDQHFLQQYDEKHGFNFEEQQQFYSHEQSEQQSYLLPKHLSSIQSQENNNNILQQEIQNYKKKTDSLQNLRFRNKSLFQNQRRQNFSYSPKNQENSYQLNSIKLDVIDQNQKNQNQEYYSSLYGDTKNIYNIERNFYSVAQENQFLDKLKQKNTKLQNDFDQIFETIQQNPKNLQHKQQLQNKKSTQQQNNQRYFIQENVFYAKNKEIEIEQNPFGRQKTKFQPSKHNMFRSISKHSLSYKKFQIN